MGTSKESATPARRPAGPRGRQISRKEFQQATGVRTRRRSR